MIDVAIVGLGKMGISHLALFRPHPDVRVVGVCDASSFVLGALSKYTAVATFSDYEQMLDEARPQAVVIATPSQMHASMARAAILRGIHVFCEKPLFLDPQEGVELTRLAAERGLVTQVGYHNRFVGSFSEVKKLLDAGAIGTVTNALAEAYGPVVLKPAGATWRSQRATGGGCLYDYAAHPIDLLTWYLGPATGSRGSRLVSIFSKEIDDAVASTLEFAGGVTAQVSVNWSDESLRKMTTRITIWGTAGKIYADRQEIQVYLRDSAPPTPGYVRGWNVKYATELTPAPWFFLRGEEYSDQVDAFVRRVQSADVDGVNTFATGTVTDQAIAMIVDDDASGRTTTTSIGAAALTPIARRPGAAILLGKAARLAVTAARRASAQATPRLKAARSAAKARKEKRSR